jgi:hypothetical protein
MVEFESFFAKIKIASKLIGDPIFGNFDLKNRTQLKTKKFVYCCVIITIVLIEVFINLAFFIPQHFDDLKLITICLPIDVSSFTSALKIFSICYQRKDLRETLAKLEELFPKTTDDKKKYCVAKYLKVIETIEKVFIIGFFNILVAGNITPILKGKFFKEFQTPNLYPSIFYEVKLIYVVMYIISNLLAFMKATLLFATELTFFVLLLLTTMQFEMLAVDLSDTEMKMD